MVNYGLHECIKCHKRFYVAPAGWTGSLCADCEGRTFANAWLGWSNTTAMKSFVCKGCGVCVFTNALPDHRRCFACLKASRLVGGPVVPAPKESAVPVAPTPHRCPVCDGRGKVPVDFYDVGVTVTFRSHPLTPLRCEACKGAGLVWG